MAVGGFNTYEDWKKVFKEFADWPSTLVTEMLFDFQTLPPDPQDEEVTSTTGLSHTLTNKGAVIETVGMVGETGAWRDTEWWEFATPHLLQFSVDLEVGHSARIGVVLEETREMLLPTTNTPFFPNETWTDLASNQAHNTSANPTPSNTNSLLHTNAAEDDEPPWFVLELKDTVNPVPSLSNTALDICGVGGSASEDSTFNTFDPEYSTKDSFMEFPDSDTETK